jgi:hypothetical protein
MPSTLPARALSSSLPLLMVLATGCRDRDPAASGGSTTGGDTTAGTSETGEPTTVPQTPVLSMPSMDAEDVSVDTELCWTAVDQPGNVRYRVYVDGAPLFAP